MSDIQSVRLEFECPQAWDKMKVVPGGRFCESCAFVVKDFTGSSGEEIQSAIKNNPGRICGRFRSVQLNNPGYFKKAAAVAIATAAGVAAACNTQLNEPAPKIPAQDFDKITLADSVELDTIYTMGFIITNIDSLDRYDSLGRPPLVADKLPQ